MLTGPALLDQLLHRPCDVLDEHVRFHPVLVEEVDAAGLEVPQRGFGDLSDVFWRFCISCVPLSLITLLQLLRMPGPMRVRA